MHAILGHHAATSDAELSEAIAGMCWQQWTPPQRHIVIKML
jgi:hypothetical protein